MHLIDPVKNIKQDVDLLADTDVDEIQFKQADLYYNQALFLEKHAITKNSLKSDFNNWAVALDVIPKTANNAYDKTEITIDYSKGIIIRYAIYKNNALNQLELVQEIKTADSQKYTNGAWLPVKMVKTPNIASGVFVSTLTYSNLQMNTGLTDLDFDPDKQ